TCRICPRISNRPFSLVFTPPSAPAERFEKWVQEFTAKLGFVILRRAVGVALALKALDEFEDDLGHAHFFRGS
ncbi:MAG: hypothetical protein O2960_17650, partial [Verrucomicrobia bacterium]|nr:hypothetical protein [Verrucomicrobiota bacterium]